MSAKTKIVVLHRKELIYTAIFAALGILFIVLLIMMFLPGKTQGTNSGSPSDDVSEDGITPTSAAVYIPGIYTTELVLGGQSVDVEVIVEESAITSIRMVNLEESVTTMYPLLEPTFDSICEQIYTTQDPDQVTYSSDNKYTSLVLLEAIKASLEKASPSPSPSAMPSKSPTTESTSNAESTSSQNAAPSTAPAATPVAEGLPAA